jgi:general secretion pathway protein K
MRRRIAPDGFIVVAVLWILGALATLVSIYAVFVIDTAASFSAQEDRIRAQGLVSAALELTAYRLTGPMETRAAHDVFAFRMGQANVVVEFRSETARIDLNFAPRELLVGLFAALGAPQGHAENYAHRIVGWRNAPSAGEDSEPSAYQKAGLRYAPRGAPFPHVNELSLVLDLPVALVSRALSFVTVYSGLPQVNALAAAPEVLAALPGMTPDRLNAFLAQRQVTPGNGQALMPLLGPSRGYATLDRGKATRVTVRIAFDKGLRIGSEVVILMFDGGTEPFSVLSWRDELDEPRPDNQPKRGTR